MREHVGTCVNINWNQIVYVNIDQNLYVKSKCQSPCLYYSNFTKFTNLVGVCQHSPIAEIHSNILYYGYNKTTIPSTT